MNLYRISQTVNRDWNTYDSAVVAAETENDARNIHPSGDNSSFSGELRGTSWCKPKEVLTAYENPTKSKEIGENHLLFAPKCSIFKE